MADTTAERGGNHRDDKPVQPDTLRRPLRRFVMKQGEKLMRAVATYEASQGLVPDTPFLDTELFPFLKEFEDRWEEIHAEATQILGLREHIPGFQEISPDQYKIATAGNWKTFILYGFGTPLDKNCKHAPVAAELLSRVPKIQTAWFSILAPGYHIPAHRGVTKGILRTHLGLIIPKEREKCRIRVGDQIKAWEAGKLFVFDDTYEHEVWNDTDEERVILLFDFDRPMRAGGRFVHWLLLKLLKLTAFYQEPKKNIRNFEDRFEAAAKRANENLEKMSHR